MRYSILTISLLIFFVEALADDVPSSFNLDSQKNLTLFNSGTSAKLIFDRLPEKAVDEGFCSWDEGVKEKQGFMRSCQASPNGRYSCAFFISLKNGNQGDTFSQKCTTTGSSKAKFDADILFEKDNPYSTPDHIQIYFEGAIAKKVYEAIPKPAIKDECTRGRAKIVNGLYCGRNTDGLYSCSVGIPLEKDAKESIFVSIC